MNDIIKGFGNLQCVREQEEALTLFELVKNRSWGELEERNFDFSSFDVWFNANSGYVFLCDENYNTLMSNDGKSLYLFISTHYNGNEGSFEDLMSIWEDLHPEDKEYMFNLATEELKEKYREQFKEVEEDD